jgi:hypothetical protein
MTEEEMEQSLAQNADQPEEKRHIKARAYAGLADGCYARREFQEARRFYTLALEQASWLPKVWVKSILLRMGSTGAFLRQNLPGVRSSWARKGPQAVVAEKV